MHANFILKNYRKLVYNEYDGFELLVSEISFIIELNMGHLGPVGGLLIPAVREINNSASHRYCAQCTNFHRHPFSDSTDLSESSKVKS